MNNYYISTYTGEEIEAMFDTIASKTIDTNCPNCGAPIVGPSCEYCRTIFDPNYLKQLTRRRLDAEIYYETLA